MSGAQCTRRMTMRISQTHRHQKSQLPKLQLLGWKAFSPNIMHPIGEIKLSDKPN